MTLIEDARELLADAYGGHREGGCDASPSFTCETVGYGYDLFFDHIFIACDDCGFKELAL